MALLIVFRMETSDPTEATHFAELAQDAWDDSSNHYWTNPVGAPVTLTSVSREVVDL